MGVVWNATVGIRARLNSGTRTSIPFSTNAYGSTTPEPSLLDVDGLNARGIALASLLPPLSTPSRRTGATVADVDATETIAARMLLFHAISLGALTARVCGRPRVQLWREKSDVRLI